MNKLFTKEMGFMAGVSVYILVLFFNSNNLTNASKTMPMAVMGLCALLIFFKVLSALSKKKSEKAVAAVIREPFSERLANWRNDEVLRSASFVLAIVAISILALVFGYIAALLMGLFFLLFYVSKIPFMKSLLITSGVMVFIYVLFVRVLIVRFPQPFWL